jgi:hypothetical protein
VGSPTSIVRSPDGASNSEQRKADRQEAGRRPARHYWSFGACEQAATNRRADANGSTPSRFQKDVHYVGDSYDFDSKNLTAYGGLLPVGTLLEKVGFGQLVEETLKVKRQTRCMPAYQFILAMVLACYVGFSRLHHLRFLQREPMLTGILGVLRLPPQCTFWRFLASLHGSVAGQLLEVQRCMRQRVWEAANMRLSAVILVCDFFSSNAVKLRPRKLLA